MQDMCNLRFAAVLGVCDEEFLNSHPAHPKGLRKKLHKLIYPSSGSPELLVRLKPGVAIKWNDLISKTWYGVKAANTLEAALRQTGEAIATKAWLEKQIQICDVSAAAVGLTGAVVGGALSFVFGVGLVAGAVGAVGAGAAKLAATIYGWQLNDIIKTLQRLQDDEETQKAEMAEFMSKTPEEWKKYAEEIEALVYA